MSHPLLKPKALVSHVLVAAVIALCVLAGQWQLDRLQQVRADNARFAERLAEDPVDLAALADPAAGSSIDDAALEFRRVEVRGTFRPDEEVLQRNRSYNNQTGFHVLTPLELEGGGVVLVRRGWVPSSLDEAPVTDAPPPSGEVTVEGVMERPVDQPDFGASDPEGVELEQVFHTDTALLDQQIDGQLFPMVLRIDEELENPTQDQLPFPVGSPELDEGSHLSYTVQWHAFALIGLLGYGAWWCSRLREDPVVAPDDDDPDGGGGTPPRPAPDEPLTGAVR